MKQFIAYLLFCLHSLLRKYDSYNIFCSRLFLMIRRTLLKKLMETQLETMFDLWIIFISKCMRSKWLFFVILDKNKYKIQLHTQTAKIIKYSIFLHFIVNCSETLSVTMIAYHCYNCWLTNHVRSSHNNCPLSLYVETDLWFCSTWFHRRAITETPLQWEQTRVEQEVGVDHED